MFKIAHKLFDSIDCVLFLFLIRCVPLLCRIKYVKSKYVKTMTSRYKELILWSIKTIIHIKPHACFRKNHYETIMRAISILNHVKRY